MQSPTHAKIIHLKAIIVVHNYSRCQRNINRRITGFERGLKFEFIRDRRNTMKKIDEEYWRGSKNTSSAEADQIWISNIFDHSHRKEQIQNKNKAISCHTIIFWPIVLEIQSFCFEESSLRTYTRVLRTYNTSIQHTTFIIDLLHTK